MKEWLLYRLRHGSTAVDDVGLGGELEEAAMSDRPWALLPVAERPFLAKVTVEL
jgi:hypothetical protein